MSDLIGILPRKEFINFKIVLSRVFKGLKDSAALKTKH